MKPINRDELYENLSGFLKTKGIELKNGSYAEGIQKTCSVLADAINLGQKGFVRARTEIGKKLDQVRQVVHEKTAPRPPAQPSRTKTTAAAKNANPKSPRSKAPPRRKRAQPKRRR